MKKIKIEGKSVSDRGEELKIVKLPVEKGKAISRPIIWPR